MRTTQSAHCGIDFPLRRSDLYSRQKPSGHLSSAYRGGQITYTYDAAGNLTALRWGGFRFLQYDAQNRPTKIVRSNG